MSSYQCENFQLFILYNFQFHHMVLKRLPDTLNFIFDFFEKSDFFLTSSSDYYYYYYSDYFFLNLLKSRYPFLDLPTLFWIFLPFLDLPTPVWVFLSLFGSSYPFLRKGGKSRKSIFGTRSS